MLLDERGYACEECGKPVEPKTSNVPHFHHKLKLRTHRHLRFEPSNIIICCPQCHGKLEKESNRLAGPLPRVLRGSILNNTMWHKANKRRKNDKLKKERAQTRRVKEPSAFKELTQGILAGEIYTEFQE